jgi:hypothetical protein
LKFPSIELPPYWYSFNIENCTIVKPLSIEICTTLKFHYETSICKMQKVFYKSSCLNRSRDAIKRQCQANDAACLSESLYRVIKAITFHRVFTPAQFKISYHAYTVNDKSHELWDQEWVRGRC